MKNEEEPKVESKVEPEEKYGYEKETNDSLRELLSGLAEADSNDLANLEERVKAIEDGSVRERVRRRLARIASALGRITEGY